MALNYEHSYVFQNLKHIKEQISDNYSSAQYINVLDKLLYKAIAPIVENTDFIDVYLTELLHLSIVNHRRKVTNLSKEKFITIVFSFLVADRNNKLKLLKKLKLERTFITFVISQFSETLASYKDVLIDSAKGSKDAAIKKTFLEKSVGYCGEATVLNVLNNSAYYLSLSQEFKKRILEKYVRHILMCAQTHYKMNSSKMELDEVIQTMFVYSSHALDKYDQTKGTLTSYISTWLQHARNQSSVNELETSFLLPHGKRAELKNASVSLDDVKELEYESNEDNDEIIRVRQLAKLADPLGFARISMGIQEYLTRGELMLQT